MLKLSHMPDFRKWLTLNLSIAGGIVVVGIAGLAALGFDISRRADAISGKRQQITDRARSIESLALLKSDAGKAGPYESQVDNALPAKDQLISFSAEITSMAKSRKLDFGFSFGAETASVGTEPGHTDFRAIISGPYEDTLALLRDIKKTRYLVKFNDLQVNENGAISQATLNGQVFFR